MPGAVKKLKKNILAFFLGGLSHKTGGKQTVSWFVVLGRKLGKSRSERAYLRAAFSSFIPYFYDACFQDFFSFFFFLFFLIPPWQAHYIAASEPYCGQTIITRVEVWLPGP